MRTDLAFIIQNPEKLPDICQFVGKFGSEKEKETLCSAIRVFGHYTDMSVQLKIDAIRKTL